MVRSIPILSAAVLALLLAGLLWLSFCGRTPAPPSSAPGVSAPVLTVQETAPETGPDLTDWQLTLVNPWHPLPEGCQPQLATVENGYQVDRRCAAALADMLAACRAEGLQPVLCSAYRTWDKQASLYENLVAKRQTQGLSLAQARASAATEVAVPGTSEHQLGLAVDIVDAGYQVLDHAQEDTPVQQWLLAHCWEYGFILRYPSDKGEVTGIIYEPWHYRYVGRDHAQAMKRTGQCLEEYLGQTTQP